VVSHDRDFLDRVAATTIAMEGDGLATVYAGGWSDYRAQRGEDAPLAAREKSAPPAPPREKPRTERAGLSYVERHRLEKLPGEIERLEAEINRLEDFLSDPGLFAREPVKFQKATEGLVERQRALEAAEEEWLQLAEKAEAE
jgi:ATP-binding cassette subfamily F protein uup